MLKTVLINPKDPIFPRDQYATYENLALGYVASYARHLGFPCVIVDAYAAGLEAKQAAELALAAEPDVVGLTCTFQSYDQARDIARIIRTRRPRAHICMGGEHATYTAEQILSEGLFDSIVQGEGELTFADLLGRLSDQTPLPGTPGLCLNTGQKIVTGPPREPVADISTLPHPARDVLADCVRTGERGLVGLLGSRGCPYRCSFCNSHRYFSSGMGPPVRYREPSDVVSELVDLYREYYVHGMYELIHFYDANLVWNSPASKRWAADIAHGILDSGIDIIFAAFLRADSFDEDDDELISLLTRAGLRNAFIGLESGSQTVLDNYNKKTSVNQNLWILDKLRMHGIRTTTNGFIMFNPYATPDDLRSSARFLVQTGQATFWNLSGRLQLFPGVAMIEQLREEGLLTPDYRSGMVHSYLFRDDRVGQLCDWLQFTHEPVPLRENSIVRYMEIVRHDLTDRLTRMDGIPQDTHDRIAQRSAECDRLRAALERENLDFFLGLVDLAETGWREQTAHSERDRYLAAADRHLDRLEHAFESFLTEVNEAI